MQPYESRRGAGVVNMTEYDGKMSLGDAALAAR